MLRMMNDKYWESDVFAGAGFGIFSVTSRPLPLGPLVAGYGCFLAHSAALLRQGHRADAELVTALTLP